MRLKNISVSLLLILAAANGFAAPAPFQHEGRAAVRAYQVQDISMDRQGQRNQPQMPQQDDNRRREFGHPESSGSGTQDERQSSSDNSRRQQMTPEERRALRR